MFKNYVFYLITSVVIFFVALGVYHVISYDPIEYLGEWEMHGLVFKGKVPKPIVLESFDFSNPTYQAEGLQKIGDSRDDFSTTLITMHGNDVHVLAVTDDNRTYFASEGILSWTKFINCLADVERVEIGKSFEGGFDLVFYYTKNWYRTIAISTLCVMAGVCALCVSRKTLYRKREKKAAQPAAKV